jgi:hypothetical protein
VSTGPHTRDDEVGGQGRVCSNTESNL